MGFSLNVICVTVLFIILRVNLSVPIEHGGNDDGEISDNAVNFGRSSQSQEKYSSIWLDPRMGKRKLSGLLRDKSKITHVLELLDEYPCSIFTLNDITGLQKRGNNLNYTPRLGRNLHDDLNTGDVTYVGDRSSFSTPSRGRRSHVSSYSPRLGRDESGSYL